jgi:quinol monooxygenase YgiN
MQTKHFKAFNAAIEDIKEDEVDIAIYSADKA